MNILREYRRIKKKSLATRISLIFTFSVILIVSTYAWFAEIQPVNLGGIEVKVDTWYVAYYIDEEIFDETATIVIDEIYPGMTEQTEIIDIYNLGNLSTKIDFELVSVKIFGNEVLDEIKENNEILREDNTTDIFSTNKNYPFDISYTYDKEYLNETYIDDISTPNGKATFKMCVNWPYREGDTEKEMIDKDLLDTKFGKDAFSYYLSGNTSESAVEIKIKITSNRIEERVKNDES